MSAVPYWEILRALGSEAVLAVTALVVLALDLARGRHMALEARRQMAGAVALLGVALAALPLVSLMGQPLGPLLGGTLVTHPLSLIFKFILIVLTALTVLMSADYDVGEHVGEYFAMLLFAAIGMLVLVGSEELLTLFVALELTSISLYILTAFHKSRLRSQEAALKYFLFGAISSAFLLFGLSYLYGLTGATSLPQLRLALQQQGLTPLLGVGMLSVLVGLGFKIAVVPFHLWAPDAYEGAPTPVTSFIATASKVASVYVLVQVVMVGLRDASGAVVWGGFAPGWAMLLGVVAAASMVLGNFVAIVQRNLKRLLAYSSIAHGGYILVGLVAAESTGAAAVLFYVIVYALTNLGAFGVVAALAARAGGDDLEHFDGMARRAPWLSLLMLIFVLSLAGVPPLGGFFGKFYLFAAALGEQFGLLWLVVLGIAMSAVSLYYYLIVLKHMYVHAPRDPEPIASPLYINIALGLTALAVIGLGIYPEPLVALLNTLLAGL